MIHGTCMLWTLETCCKLVYICCINDILCVGILCDDKDEYCFNNPSNIFACGINMSHD